MLSAGAGSGNCFPAMDRRTEGAQLGFPESMLGTIPLPFGGFEGHVRSELKLYWFPENDTQTLLIFEKAREAVISTEVAVGAISCMN